MSLPQLLLEVAGLLALAVLLGLLARRVHVPQTVVLVVVGFLASAVGVIPAVGRLEGEAFEEVVVFAFLPALVFAAALGVDLRAFSRNLGAILGLATVAFGVSAVVVGLTLHWVLGTALVVAFLFGVLISATDPVAVVAIFREVGVPPAAPHPRRGGEPAQRRGRDRALLDPRARRDGWGHRRRWGGGRLRDRRRQWRRDRCPGGPGCGRRPAVARPVAGGRTLVGGRVRVVRPRGRGPRVLRRDRHRRRRDGALGAGAEPGFGRGAHRVGGDLGGAGLHRERPAVPADRAGARLRLARRLSRGGPARDRRRPHRPRRRGHSRGLAARAARPDPSVRPPERGRPRVGRPARRRRAGPRAGAAGRAGRARAPNRPHRRRRPGDAAPQRNDHQLARPPAGPGPAGRRRALPFRGRQALGHRSRPKAVGRPGARGRDRGHEAARRKRAGGPRRAGAPRPRRGPAGEGRAGPRAAHRAHDVPAAQRPGGLLPPTVTRTLLHEVDDEVDDLALRAARHEPGADRRERSRLDQISRKIVGVLPKPPGEDPEEMAYAEAAARRLAARRTGEALDLFDRLPEISPETVDVARDVFRRWEQRAIEELDELDERSGAARRELHERQALLLAEAAADRELTELVQGGLLPERLRSELPRLLRPAGRG